MIAQLPVAALRNACCCLQAGWTAEDSAMLAQLLEPSEAGVPPLKAPLLLVRNKVDLAQGASSAAEHQHRPQPALQPAAEQVAAAAPATAAAGSGAESTAPALQQLQPSRSGPGQPHTGAVPAAQPPGSTPSAHAPQATAPWAALELADALRGAAADHHHSSSLNGAQPQTARGQPWHQGRCVDTSAAQLQGLPELVQDMSLC